MAEEVKQATAEVVEKAPFLASWERIRSLFPDGKTELYWDYQLEEAKESAFRSKLRRVFW